MNSQTAHAFLNDQFLRDAIGERVRDGVENFNRPWFCQTKTQGFGPYTGIGRTKQEAKAEALKECGIFCNSNQSVQCEERDRNVIEDAINGDRNNNENQDQYISRLQQRIDDLQRNVDRKKDEISFLRKENDELRRNQGGHSCQNEIQTLVQQLGAANENIRQSQSRLNNCNSENRALMQDNTHLSKELRLCRGEDHAKPDLSAAQIDACDYATNSSDLAMCLKLTREYELSPEIIAACDYAATSSDIKYCLEAVGKRRPANPVSVITSCDYATAGIKDLVDCIFI